MSIAAAAPYAAFSLLRSLILLAAQPVQEAGTTTFPTARNILCPFIPLLAGAYLYIPLSTQFSLSF